MISWDDPMCSGTNDALVTISLEKEKYQTSVKERAKDPVEWSEQCELWVHHQHHCHHHRLWAWKGTSKDASFVNLNSPATPPPITESPYLSSDESHWEVKTAIAPLLWRQLEVISIFGDHRIWHQNMASWYGHQFSWEVHLLQHFKDGNQKNNASLVTAWNCVIFQICCKYPTKESMGINAILTSAWAVTKYGKRCSFEGSWKLWGQLKTGQFLQHKALAVPSLTHCQV